MNLENNVSLPVDLSVLAPQPKMVSKVGDENISETQAVVTQSEDTFVASAENKDNKQNYKSTNLSGVLGVNPKTASKIADDLDGNFVGWGRTKPTRIVVGTKGLPSMQGGGNELPLDNVYVITKDKNNNLTARQVTSSDPIDNAVAVVVKTKDSKGKTELDVLPLYGNDGTGRSKGIGLQVGFNSGRVVGFDITEGLTNKYK